MTERLRELVSRLGGSYHGTYATLPGPGHSRTDRSLSVKEGAEGRIVFFSHAGDSVRDVQAYLNVPTGAPLSDATGTRRTQAPDPARQAKLAFCGRLWRSGVPMNEDIGAAYLWEHRGVDFTSPELRFHPACPRGYDDERTHPAILAQVQDHDGASIGLHVTLLTPQGDKLKRLMFGYVAGGAVRLSTLGPLGHVAICEGIETALSFGVLHSVPAWAVLSANGIRTFVPPRGVRRVIVGPDADDRGVSMLATKALVERLNRRCEVIVAPAPEGRDWNDVARGVA